MATYAFYTYEYLKKELYIAETNYDCRLPYSFFLNTTVSFSAKFSIPEKHNAKILQISTSHPPEKRSISKSTPILSRNEPVQERL